MTKVKSIPIRKFASRYELASAESLTIRRIRVLRNERDFVQELHRHDFFFLLVLEQGKGDHEIDFVPYKVAGKSAFFLRPGQVHQLTLKAVTEGYLVSFETDLLSSLDQSFNQLLRKASSKNYWQLGASQFKRVVQVLNSIFTEYTEKQDGYQEVIKANLKIFLIELLRHKSSHDSNSKKENTYQQERLEKFLELLEANIRTEKQVQHYADRLHLSTYQLNAITKATVGKTCSQLIDEHLVLEAKRQLLATSNQVVQIADQLGYEDVSYFIRFFKKHTGYSPESFRNNFK